MFVPHVPGGDGSGGPSTSQGVSVPPSWDTQGPDGCLAHLGPPSPEGSDPPRPSRALKLSLASPPGEGEMQAGGGLLACPLPPTLAD